MTGSPAGRPDVPLFSVGLTGNVAAGKSAVARHFAERGAFVTDADALVRELQRPGTPVFEAIVARFGPGVVARDGTLDRPALRALVLADPEALAALNAIVHPAVRSRRNDLDAEARRRGARIVVHDIPLLFEAGNPDDFDFVLLVDAPEAVRRDRLVRLRGLPEADADRLIRAQLPAAAKRARSDAVIENDGDLADLAARADAAWRAITAAADAA